jgi:hypothetical protein
MMTNDSTEIAKSMGTKIRRRWPINLSIRSFAEKFAL